MRLHLRRVLTTCAVVLGTLWFFLTMMPSVPDMNTSQRNRMSEKVQEPQQLSKSTLRTDMEAKLVEEYAAQYKNVEEHSDGKNPHIDDIYLKSQPGNQHDIIDLPMYKDGRKNNIELWPEHQSPHNDRILDQMRYVPEKTLKKNPDDESNYKVIYMPGGIGSDMPKGRKKFTDEKCPVDLCWLTDSMQWRQKADVVLFQNEYYYDNRERPPHQIWILWLLESPFHTGSLAPLHNYINWTATYRSDSTIVTPYEKFVHFSNFSRLPDKPKKNYAEGKKYLVAWFVSNCAARNKRWEYVQALRMHGVDVHVYGACGTYQCDRYVPGLCDTRLSEDYKFYLSFENSNCEHYITEKFYWNGLKNDIIPIVMGARREDYFAVAPPHSYVHVEDFEGPRQLAEFMLKVDKDDDLYNQFFRWKGTGEFINTKFWCRLCSLVHSEHRAASKNSQSGVSRFYSNVEEWWRGKKSCVYDRWDANDPYISDWDLAGI